MNQLIIEYKNKLKENSTIRYPWHIPDEEQKNDKYHDITLKDLITYDIDSDLVNYFIEEKKNDSGADADFQFYYDCEQFDREGFFNVIPSVFETFTYLKELVIVYGEITKIEHLPPFIEHLDLSNNKIKKIENIPDKVKKLNLSDNKITVIENVPNSVEHLYVYNCVIKTIIDLPSCLDKLIIEWKNVKLVNSLDHFENYPCFNHYGKESLPPYINSKAIWKWYDYNSDKKNTVNEINMKFYVVNKWKFHHEVNKMIDLVCFKDYQEDDDDDECFILKKMLICLILKIQYMNKYDNLYFNMFYDIDHQLKMLKHLYKRKKENAYLTIIPMIIEVIHYLNILKVITKKIKMSKNKFEFDDKNKEKNKRDIKVNITTIYRYNPFNKKEKEIYKMFLKYLKQYNSLNISSLRYLSCKSS